MEIYGADFSGARDASKGIYYAKGILKGSTLTIEEVRHCDDRLDLFAAIVSTKAPWGLDFSFALSTEAYKLLGISDWQGLLEFASSTDREDFMAFLAERAPQLEASCQKHCAACRLTEAQVKAFSSFKKYNPNMRALVYGGFKLLAYLRQNGVRVFPFDKLDYARSRAYEVYPSATWAKVKMKRTTDLALFRRAFNALGLLELKLPPQFSVLENQDAADSVVACLTLGAAIQQFALDQSWEQPLPNITPEEWKLRFAEGIIVRI